MIRNARARRYRPLEPKLPIDETVEAASGEFAIGLPWPWYSVDDDQGSPGDRRELLLAAPRADGQPVGIEFTVEHDEFELDDRLVSRHSREFARSFTGGSTEAPRRLLIGGLPAVELLASTHTQQHRLLIVPDGAKTYRAETLFPASMASAYAVHLDCIFASWLWR